MIKAEMKSKSINSVPWVYISRTNSVFLYLETKNAGFSKDVCRSMVAMMDIDRSGKLGFEEFKALWMDIRHWKVI